MATENPIRTSEQGVKLYDIRSLEEPEQLLLDRFIRPAVTAEQRVAELRAANGSILTRKLPPRLRVLPTEILYDTVGLHLFSKITELQEYYLTRCESEILYNKIGNIAEFIPHGASVIELGCGSMAKTSIILEGLRASGKKGLRFHALDIDEAFLKSSLVDLVNAEEEKGAEDGNRIEYAGILGTYDDGVRKIFRAIPGPKVMIWLGSSIGNYSRDEAVRMMRRFRSTMDKGDLFLLGADKRNDPTRVAKAYNDSKGVTRDFSINGLWNLNSQLGSQVFKLDNFEHYAGYNPEEGRHEAYYRSLKDQKIQIPEQHSVDGTSEVQLAEDELIRFEVSYKYGPQDIQDLVDGCGMRVKESWTDNGQLYNLFLLEIDDDKDDVGKYGMPTLAEWKDVWRQWDWISGPKMVEDYDDQPIMLRHPFVFYVGHIPTFCDVMISDCLGEDPTPPAHYRTIFQRGIDPNVENPALCHDHSVVPDTWPDLEDLFSYRRKVCDRVVQLYKAIETGQISTQLRRLGRVLFMALEHESMHTETLTYMLVQSEKIMKRCIPLPFDSFPGQLKKTKWLYVKEGEAVIGFDDGEGQDLVSSDIAAAYGWDNEIPRRRASLTGFEIQHRPVTNQEYLQFLNRNPFGDEDLVPSSFAKSKDGKIRGVKTLYGIVPYTKCMNWPVCLSYDQAAAYMKDLQTVEGDQSIRMPTEAELVRFYQEYGDRGVKNIEFENLSPVDLTDDVHLMGSVWEWTSTVLDEHSGFVSSEIYPGYTSDFFDGKHNVVRGASWATRGRSAGRLRNFYQRSYPFAFVGVKSRELEDSRVELTLTVPAEITQRTYENHLKKVELNTQLPGFRKGQKLPLQLLLRSRGGEKSFNGEVLQQIIEKAADQALKNWQGRAIEDSDKLESDVRELLDNFDPDESLEFKISFDVLSEVKWKSPFSDIKVTVEEKGNKETDALNVERYIRQLLKKNATQSVVVDRGMEMGDIAIMDFDFVRPDNREPLPHLRQEKFRFDTDLPDMIGVMDSLLGIRVGETREKFIKFPDDWEPSVYRGIEATAVVTCHELFKWNLPELTDEVVQSLEKPSIKTVEELKESLLVAETGRRAERLKDAIQDAIMDELASIVDMNVSETALMETAKVRYQAMLLDLQSKGRIGPKALESMASEAMLNNYMMSNRSQLERDQKAVAAMQKVFEELQLEVSEEEVEAEVVEAERGFQEMGEEYSKDRLQEIAREILQNNKVVEWFVKNGNVEILPYEK